MSRYSILNNDVYMISENGSKVKIGLIPIGSNLAKFISEYDKKEKTTETLKVKTTNKPKRKKAKDAI